MKNKEKKGLIKEFKEFISKGNVMDMAIGVIVATAFGKITTSLVNDVFMPFIAWIFGARDMTALNIVIKEPTLAEDGITVLDAGITIGFGTFVGTIIDFILVAMVVFIIVKTMNKMRKKKEAAPAAPPAPSKEEVLLTEIRDILKEKN